MKNIEHLVHKIKEKEMKQYISGVITGLVLTVSLFLFVGATQQRADDSLNTIMGQLDNYVKDQLGKDKAAGRFQLQSFQIESCLLYTSPSPRDKRQSRMPSSA